jgi:hypothetical protein
MVVPAHQQLAQQYHILSYGGLAERGFRLGNIITPYAHCLDEGNHNIVVLAGQQLAD